MKTGLANIIFVIDLNFLCLSLFTVLFLYVASFLGCFMVWDLCKSGCRQNFVNFYLTLCQALGQCRGVKNRVSSGKKKANEKQREERRKPVSSFLNTSIYSIKCTFSFDLLSPLSLSLGRKAT